MELIVLVIAAAVIFLFAKTAFEAGQGFMAGYAPRPENISDPEIFDTLKFISSLPQSKLVKSYGNKRVLSVHTQYSHFTFVIEFGKNDFNINVNKESLFSGNKNHNLYFTKDSSGRYDMELIIASIKSVIAE